MCSDLSPGSEHSTAVPVRERRGCRDTDCGQGGAPSGLLRLRKRMSLLLRNARHGGAEGADSHNVLAEVQIPPPPCRERNETAKPTSTFFPVSEPEQRALTLKRFCAFKMISNQSFVFCFFKDRTEEPHNRPDMEIKVFKQNTKLLPMKRKSDSVSRVQREHRQAEAGRGRLGHAHGTGRAARKDRRLTPQERGHSRVPPSTTARGLGPQTASSTREHSPRPASTNNQQTRDGHGKATPKRRKTRQQKQVQK